MLKTYLTLQIKKQTDRCLKEKIKKITGLVKDELGGKIMDEIVGLRAKTYRYLIDDGSENKTAKSTKMCVIKKELKFQNYKNCLNAAKIDGKLKYLENKKFNVDKVQELVKNKTILKTQQRFKSERQNVFTEVIKKIALYKNDDKRILSMDSTEANAHGTNKDIIHLKGKIKHYNMT